MIDISQQRLDLAKTFAVTHFINSEKEDPIKIVLEITDGQGVDIVITACSAKSVQEQALEMIAKKGRISYFAGVSKDDPYIKFNSNILHYKEVSLFGAFASSRSHFEKAYELIASGKIDAGKFITHKFPLDKIIDAFDLKKEAQGLKSVIEI